MKTSDRNPPIVCLSSSEADTIAIARVTANFFVQGDLCALMGDLGMGKSVFARAVIHTIMGYDLNVPSPTYTLVQTYEGKRFPLMHFDLYRLENSEDVIELGWQDRSHALALVEWPEKLDTMYPAICWEVIFQMNQEVREITISPPPGFEERYCELKQKLLGLCGGNT
ncbi:MAG: tRNA (adenosine(37)-N6)-threonylcarbamoyltransferase complex ATPase subunit type 1 TsaE [Alphaproteobacteria bacterium]|nr:MAG: tRNA (adenosine(37)-N6)-threonylcarbamoyltransferase complex ATPase subunit type 1 TsaE [Alphaproteobacteria bacterium]